MLSQTMRCSNNVAIHLKPLQVRRIATLKHGLQGVRHNTIAAEYGSDKDWTSAFARGPLSGFSLGTENSKRSVPEQGWQFETRIREATIKAAGNGRFAMEPAKKGEQLIQKVLMPMSTIISLASLPNDTTITFNSVDDLESYITLALAEGGYSRSQILQQFKHFMYGFDGEVCCLNYSTWTVNHASTASEGLNIIVQEKKLDDGRTAYEGICVKDVKPGDELYMDCRRFKLPEFYIDYAKKHGFRDVRHNTLTAVYGSDEQAQTGTSEFAWVRAASFARNPSSGFSVGTENAKRNVLEQGRQYKPLFRKGTINGSVWH